MKLAMMTLVVADYDEAIRYYCGTLGFKLIEDTAVSADKRWVVVAPGGEGGRLLLAKAANDRQRAAIGDQSGGRVFLFLYTEDFDRDHAALKARGVDFIETPRSEPYGKVVVFKDIYGNKWDLLEQR